MTGNPLELTGPELGYWNEDKGWQLNESHQVVVEGPPLVFPLQADAAVPDPQPEPEFPPT
jgi:hypothetical protein